MRTTKLSNKQIKKGWKSLADVNVDALKKACKTLFSKKKDKEDK